MAGFAVHMTGGVFAGAITGAAGFHYTSADIWQAGATFILGLIGGLLPDLDSDTGKPLSLLFQIASVMIPAIVLARTSLLIKISPEFAICYFIAAYLFINYAIQPVVKRLTVHRGIMHSIPFAFLCGGFSYYIFMPSGAIMSDLAAISVTVGCLVHLILDEFSSFTLNNGFVPAVKQSRLSALKFWSPSPFATFSVYLSCGLVAYAIWFHA